MSAYLITYDLCKPGQEYEELYEEIKEIANGWWHNLESTWIIKHSGPADYIHDRLKAYIDENDKLVVARLTGEAAWKGLSTKGSNWLKKNL